MKDAMIVASISLYCFIAAKLIVGAVLALTLTGAL